MERVSKLTKTFSIVLLVCLAFTVCVYFIIPSTASADSYLSSADEEWLKTMTYEIAEEEGYTIDPASFVISEVYYANETFAGYVLDFDIECSSGYIIFFKYDATFKLIEFGFENHSPYYGKKGLYIYPSLGYYFIKQNNCYFDAETLNPVDYEPSVDDLFFAANNSDDKKGVPHTRNVDYYYGYFSGGDVSCIANFVCGYATFNMGDEYTNNCACVAGVIVLDYWNKFYNNDLLKLRDIALDNDGHLEINAAIKHMKILYDYMDTNWFFGTGGTLPNSCYNGFERLIKENGYKVSRTTNLSYEKMVENIDNGIPIFIFSRDYYFTTGTYNKTLPDAYAGWADKTLTIEYEHTWGINNAHTFVGYGYASYSLYDKNHKNFHERFIRIADCWGESRYFNYDISNVHSSAAIRVYK